MDQLLTMAKPWIAKFQAETNVFLFLPNLIGYARIVFALLACLTMQFSPGLTLLFYFLSAFLDAFDGIAARHFNQSTKFGAMLDQLTDRCGTMCLMFALGQLYPNWLFFFQISAAIDIAGHWIHTQVALMSGKNSHKMIDLKENKILHIYYTNRPVLFAACFLNELFYVALYGAYYYEGSHLILFGFSFWWLAFISFFFAVGKAGITLLHIWAACLNLREIDIVERSKAQK